MSVRRAWSQDSPQEREAGLAVALACLNKSRIGELLAVAASRLAGPHPPQILTECGGGFLFGSPGDPETWWGRGQGRGRFASKNAAHEKKVGARYHKRCHYGVPRYCT
jgi:hypothetical protein